jgi:hypothetical protein
MMNYSLRFSKNTCRNVTSSSYQIFQTTDSLSLISKEKSGFFNLNPENMKLNSTLFVMKTLAAVLLMLTTTFTYGRISDLNAPPVFWNIFDANVKKGNTVELSWVVTEYNNKSFYIQHSLNGSDWEDVAHVPSKNSPESLEDYSYTHINSLSGKHYYRIKQVDISVDRTGYSKVITVELKNDKDVIIWPNPATDQIRIVNNGRGADFYAKAQIFDLSGTMRAEKKLQSGINTIAVNELPPGHYLVRIESNNGAINKQKFIKQ